MISVWAKVLHLKKRRSRNYNSTSAQRLKVLVVLILLSMAAHVAIMHFYEGKGLWESTWLTATTIVTVGYGDLSASTVLGQVATIVLLYASGIFLVTGIVDLVLDVKRIRLEIKKNGRWKWKMSNHILIINAPEKNQKLYFERLFDQINSSVQYSNHDIQVLMKDLPSDELTELFGNKSVNFFKGKASNPEDLQDVDADSADVVLILARDGDELSDSHTFDTLNRIRCMNKSAHVVVETLNDYEQPRMKAAGANAVIRAIRAYPEMIVRSITCPGSEEVIVNLFSSYGDECKRFDTTTNGFTWMEVVQRIMQANVGTPIAYIDSKGDVITNPGFNVIPSAKSILVLVKEGNTANTQFIQELLDH